MLVHFYSLINSKHATLLVHVAIRLQRSETQNMAACVIKIHLNLTYRNLTSSTIS